MCTTLAANVESKVESSSDSTVRTETILTDIDPHVAANARGQASGDVKSSVLSVEKRTEDVTDPLLRIGAAVEARYRGRLTWFKATVKSVAPNGNTVDLQYDDGALATKVPRLRVRAEGEREALLLRAGDRCEARFKGGRRCFPAVVINAHRDGLHYMVEYDDGDKVIIGVKLIFLQFLVSPLWLRDFLNHSCASTFSCSFFFFFFFPTYR
jgi:hypothetical protein